MLTQTAIRSDLSLSNTGRPMSRQDIALGLTIEIVSRTLTALESAAPSQYRPRGVSCCAIAQRCGA